jgi:PAS domain S-box-containing protein
LEARELRAALAAFIRHAGLALKSMRRQEDLGIGSEERERSVRESEERCRNFIEQSTEGIWRLELEEPIPIDLAPNEHIERFYRHGYLAECNDAMARMYGYARAEEIVGTKLDELIPRAVRENVDYLREFARSEYRLTNVESRELDQHGNTKYFLNNLAGIVEKGLLVRAWGTQRDITEQKKNEEAVRQSELLYHTVVDQAAENIFLVEAESRRIVESNPAFQETLGYTEEELGSMTLYDVVAADRKSVDLNIQRSLEERRRFVGERKYRRKDGSLVDVEVSASIIIHKGRETMCVVAHDITERKRAEEVNSRLAAIVESSNDAIIGKTLDGIVTSWNRGAQQMYTYTPEEIVGKSISVLAPPDRHGEITAILEKLRRGARVNDYETVRIKKDGERIDVSLTVSPIMDTSGNVVGASTIARDITERKRVEERQRFLAKAGAMLSSSLDYPTTLASVANLAVPYLADWCVIDILEDDGSLDRLAMTHQDPEKIRLAHQLQERYPPDPDAPHGVGQVLRTGQSELVPEIPEPLIEEAAHDAEHREILRRLGLKSYMIVPLVARGRTLGAISLVSAESGRRYGQAELELTEELARRAGLAVDNARLYKGHVKIARTLQEGLLPSRLPEVPGVEVGLSYLSAGEVDVGGDFYDLFETSVVDQNGSSKPCSSWGAVLGDVSGKGAEAAAVLAFARYTIRALATRESYPSAVLTGLNKAMLRQRREHDDYKFCTVAYAKLEMNESDHKGGAKVTVCRGGHAPPFLLRADGSVRRTGHPGYAIGVFDNASFIGEETRLAPGDALVFYTDGVLEARSPDGAFFGEERLLTLLRSSADLSASTIADRIKAAALYFQENEPRDDIAVLVLRVPD